MKNKIKIPKGWKELRVGSLIRWGDKCWAWGKGPWDVIDDWAGTPYCPTDGGVPAPCGYGHHTHIRRIAPKKPRKGRAKK